MEIDWVTIVNKVPEIALLVVFIWFTLKMVESSRASAVSIMGEWKTYLSNQNTKWQEYFDQRDEIYFAKIGNAQDRHSKEIEILSSDLQDQTAIMKEMLVQMGKHDELLRFIAEDVKERRSANREK